MKNCFAIFNIVRYLVQWAWPGNAFDANRFYF
jgi:hypothetical protein